MEKKSISISVIIIAKNEEVKILGALDSVAWADEIIVVDSGSTDKTVAIARSKKAVVYSILKGGFSEWRNFGAEKAKGTWLFYLDADERVTPELKNEILSVINNDKEEIAYAIPRKNIIFGKEMHYGGLWPDYVKRLIRKDKFEGWLGNLHENPTYDGKLSHLKKPLTHLKHQYLSEMVVKTNKWSEIEADLLLKSRHPRMVWWRFFRIMLTELWYRLVVLQGYRDGQEGVIYAIYQMWSRFMTYGKLWERQIAKESGK